MQQILFHIPFTQGWFGMPDGVPLYGFGVMLFLCFVLTAMVWGPRRAVQVGLPKERLQDMAILLFVTGIAGARIVYMMQYSDQFKGKNLLAEFFKIWEGGIVFYGSAIGGVIGFLLFRHFVLKKLGVSVWKLGDAVAPLIALGLAVGRIGCYLNGCCWGQVALPEAQPVPLAAEMGQYPLLVCHAREQCVVPPTDGKQLPQVWGVQTSTGFTTKVEYLLPNTGTQEVKRPAEVTVVTAVEKGSAAEAVLKPGDKILKVNGTAVGKNAEAGEKTAGELLDPATWPRWKKDIQLEIQRGDETKPVSFTPKTVTLFPTQLYEVVSMALLILLLLAYQPFRRHDGQVLVLLMLGYGVHRWFNEAIRIEPSYALGMTLSQWVSVGFVAGAIVLELYLRKTQPKLPKGPLPLSYGSKPVPVTKPGERSA